MTILCIGDIVGRPGRDSLKPLLETLRAEQEIDFILANGENAAGGSGLTPKILEELLALGIDVITTGDHIYKNKEILSCIGNERLLRPCNYPPAAAGRGAGIFESKQGLLIGAINLAGRVFMDPSESPFLAVDKWLEEIQGRAKVLLVDFHAEATSEKISMGWYLDGRVSAIFGTHTHVQTADEKILPLGTAYLTDLGMTGSQDGVIGRDKNAVLSRFTTGMPARFEVCTGNVRLQGALIKVDPDSGKALAIERVNLPLAEAKES
ncbi:MAG: TIGR00282 family metallophosphoesterase [Planctomycetes bacterium]|nr:TIGR00282 family metallophosphoesterase [Planctomycetota bacterium]